MLLAGKDQHSKQSLRLAHSPSFPSILVWSSQLEQPWLYCIGYTYLVTNWNTMKIPLRGRSWIFGGWASGEVGGWKRILSSQNLLHVLEISLDGVRVEQPRKCVVNTKRTQRNLKKELKERRKSIPTGTTLLAVLVTICFSFMLRKTRTTQYSK